MPDRPNSPSELERRARYTAYVAARTEADRRGHPMPDSRTVRAALDAYLAATLPDHDARVRAEVAEEIAQAIEEADRHVGVTAADMARTVRAHATTEEDRRGL